MEKYSNEKGITLIALVVTIVVLLILAGVSIAMLTGENGIIKNAQDAKIATEEGTAREKLELELANMHIEKAINKDYNEDQYLTDKLTEKGFEVGGNLVIVDGWKFRIDRSVPKIVESLGKGIINEEIEIQWSETEKPETDYTEATLTITITSTQELEKITLDGQEITVTSSESGGIYTYTYINEKITENGKYFIYAEGKDGTCNYETIEIKSLTEDMAISNKEELIDFRNKVNSGRTFKDRTVTVVADIDLNEGKYTVAGDGTTTFTTDAEQWTPIANYSADKTLIFKGTFDGQNHVISGMYINNTSVYQGLFGAVEGNIKNIKIANSNINAGYIIGTIVCQMQSGIMENCHVDKTVKVNNHTARSDGGSYVGGLIGVAEAQTYLKIEKCSNKANVSAVGNIVGGIIGSAGTTDIIECYNSGNISGNNNIGGILGRNHTNITNITNTYNIGNISGNQQMGGILGVKDNVGTVNIENAYNKGTITGSSYYGQIIGRELSSATKTNIYGSTQDVTAELLGEAFTNDIQNSDGTWKYNNSYPILKWQLVNK